MALKDTHHGGYTFADLAIVPRLAPVAPEGVELGSRLTNTLHLGLPLVASPMDTVTDAAVARRLASLGAFAVLHHNYPSLDDQVAAVREVAQAASEAPGATRLAGRLAVGALVPTDPLALTRIERLVEVGVSLVAIDSIHVTPHRHVETLRAIKSRFPDLQVMSGNVVHAEDCRILIEQGADCIRLGYGSGSVNDGLLVLGMGRPLARSIAECAPVCHRAGVPLVADGGIHSSGHVALACALGADAVMLGRMFAACSGTPGTFELNERGELIKHYRGMSRQELIDDGMPAEGRDLELRCSGTLEELTQRLSVNLRNSVARAGCRRLSDLFAASEVELLTQAARQELGSGS